MNTAESPTPTVAIQDKTKQQAPPNKVIQTIQRTSSNILKSLSSFRSEVREDLTAIKRELTDLHRLIEDIKLNDKVSELIASPNKYIKDISAADWLCMSIGSVKYFEPYEVSEEEEEYPALIQITWRGHGSIIDLNPAEVRALKKRYFRVSEVDDVEPVRNTPYYVDWMEKAPHNLWLSVMEDAHRGLCWHVSTAPTIKAVRDKTRASWVALVEMNSSNLRTGAEETDTPQSVIRESQSLLMHHRVLVETVPREMLRGKEIQSALTRLRKEALLLSTEDELLEPSARREDPLDEMSLNIINKSY